MNIKYGFALVSFLSMTSIFCEVSTTEITESSFILKPSPGSEVGIFATHDISEGTIIVFFDENYKFREMRKEDIPAEFLKYCVAKSDDVWLCPPCFNRMEIVWYVNHSDVPNIKRIKSGIAKVIKPIKKGEQVTIDFNDFNEPEQLRSAYNH